MPAEIERKFLVDVKLFFEWVKDQTATIYKVEQGYPVCDSDMESRVRAKTKIGSSETNYTVTFKSANKTLTRSEFEFCVDGKVARELLNTCYTKIDKTRYVLNNAHVVDIFEGEHEGLCIMEIEFDSEEEARAYQVSFPFVTKEVTGDVNYYNAILAGVPWPLSIV